MGVLFGLLLECRVNLGSTDFNGIQAGKGGHCGALWSIIRIRTKKVSFLVLQLCGCVNI